MKDPCFCLSSSTCLSRWRCSGTWTSSMPKCTSSWITRPENWSAPTTRWSGTAKPLSKRSRGEKDVEFPYPFYLFNSYLICWKLCFVFLPLKLDGDHWDIAEQGGVLISAGGAAPLYGAAPSQEGEKGATQNHPFLSMFEGALHGTTVGVSCCVNEMHQLSEVWLKPRNKECSDDWDHNPETGIS